MSEHNEIYDDKVVKFTVNLPIELYAKITAVCRERREPRAVWVRQALERAFNTSYTTKELIQYEIMRHLGEIRSENHVPKMEKAENEARGSTRPAPDHNLHYFPGFGAILQGNYAVLNKYRREKLGQ